jgi:hypothetical protein
MNRAQKTVVGRNSYDNVSKNILDIAVQDTRVVEMGLLPADSRDLAFV